jgi:hypothetical protein
LHNQTSFRNTFLFPAEEKSKDEVLSPIGWRRALILVQPLFQITVVRAGVPKQSHFIAFLTKTRERLHFNESTKRNSVARNENREKTSADVATNIQSLIKSSRATSQVKCTSVQLVVQYPEDEDGDGPRNVSFFAIQPFDAAGSPRRFYYT